MEFHPFSDTPKSYTVQIQRYSMVFHLESQCYPHLWCFLIAINHDMVLKFMFLFGIRHQEFLEAVRTRSLSSWGLPSLARSLATLLWERTRIGKAMKTLHWMVGLIGKINGKPMKSHENPTQCFCFLNNKTVSSSWHMVQHALLDDILAVFFLAYPAWMILKVTWDPT